MTTRTFSLHTQSVDHAITRRSFGAGIAAIAAFASTGTRWAHASEVQTTPPVFSIPATVAPALQSQSLIGDPWACSVSEAIADKVGLGRQIRVCRNSDHCAVYTISEIRAADDDNEIRISKAGRERLGTGSSGFASTLRQALATSTLSDTAAKNASEYIERIEDSGDHQGLLLMAPHGGSIEINTDRQVRRIADSLAGADVSTWCCKGWKQSGGAYDRWHVTSTAIHPHSFPGLAKVSNRDYAYAVSFHGMSAAGVLIGGAASNELKQLVRQAISNALGGAAGPVTIAQGGDALGGSAPANVTNWVTVGGCGGIQIEQSYAVRSQYWRDVADAVASVYGGLL